MNAVVSAFADGAVITRRNLLKIKRVPDVLVFSTLSPIMFVLLFAYVFGSAIEVPGVNYREFLMAGIFVQTVVFGATWTGASLAEDLQKGIIDRFRTLPMSGSAVLLGRTAADVGINLVTFVVMALSGLVVGWRVRSSVPEAILAVVLLLTFAYAISWIMAVVGLSVRTPEVVNNASFIVIFPMTFIANTFVPTGNLPTVVKFIAEWNPVSSVTQAARELFGNTNPAVPVPDTWALRNPVAYSLIWIGAALVVFMPLAIRQYRRAASR
ncbi:ABC transporter permease [Couchioplanes azureus]|uniref:ABC transporter permease n=1 Tax=Couchioplanes caeruleus TaxID=56438 RepID=UPI00167108DF|nr:ABC transporter permease [Couchioplanes caeruleus]GGQ69095.1 transport permease protein [Couchioplanes caeruleus subsp. azureus]